MSCNVEQAGIYRIILYENKGVDLVYRDANTIREISNTGDVVTLENSDDDTMELDFTFKSKRSANNKLSYKHTIIWKQLGLDDSNIDLINTLKKSIYGWIPVIEFYNKSQKIITNPFRFTESIIDNNISNHYEITLDNINFSDNLKMIDFAESITYLFEDDIDYLFEDSNEYLFE